jgi:hypothetical protein
MMRTLTRRRRRGQSIVEMVLLLPILLMMILGMVDFTLAFTAHTKLRNAVAEGGYWAAQNPGDVEGARNQILAALQQLRPAVRDQDIEITPCVADDGEFQTVISVRYNYPLLFGIFGGGSHVQLRNATTIPQFGGCR